MTENTSTSKMRLAKYLAMAGIASRRNCEQLIIDGRVSVNGIPVTTPAHTVDPAADKICFEGKPLDMLSRQRVYILLNKPAGYTCAAKDIHARELVYELIPNKFGRLFTIGRLDRDSEGLLILTNDGDYAQRLIHPSMRVTKRYYVECSGQYSTNIRRQMLDGMYDNDEFLRALAVEQKSFQRGRCALEITLGDGRKREVRRLCKDVGLQVLLLRRVAVGCLKLDENLPVGSWRMMTDAELQLAITPETIAPPASNAPAAREPRPYWQINRRPRPEGKSGRTSHSEEEASFGKVHRPAPARRRSSGGDDSDFSRSSHDTASGSKRQIRRKSGNDDWQMAAPAENAFRKNRAYRRGTEAEESSKKHFRGPRANGDSDAPSWYKCPDREFEGYKEERPRQRNNKAPWMKRSKS